MHVNIWQARIQMKYDDLYLDIKKEIKHE